MTSNPIALIMSLVSGAACAFVCVGSLKFALSGTNPDAANAREDGPKTIGARLAALFVGIFCALVSLMAAQMVFVGRIVWLPFF